MAGLTGFHCNNNNNNNNNNNDNNGSYSPEKNTPEIQGMNSQAN